MLILLCYSCKQCDADCFAPEQIPIYIYICCIYIRESRLCQRQGIKNRPNCYFYNRHHIYYAIAIALISDGGILTREWACVVNRFLFFFRLLYDSSNAPSGFQNIEKQMIELLFTFACRACYECDEFVWSNVFVVCARANDRIARAKIKQKITHTYCCCWCSDIFVFSFLYWSNSRCVLCASYWVCYWQFFDEELSSLSNIYVNVVISFWRKILWRIFRRSAIDFLY